MADNGFLRSWGCIAAGSTWTTRQADLAGKLAGSLAGILDDPLMFMRDTFQALAPRGDLTGLAYRSESGKQVLGLFLRCVLAEAEREGILAKDDGKIHMAAVERLEAALAEWSATPKWKFLQGPPRSTRNRVLHFHYSILDAPSYPWVAARMQLGIAAKIDQLARLPAGRADKLLGGALSPVIHIVRAIPAGRLSGGEADTPAGLDRIAWETVCTLPRRRTLGRPGRRYARSSLHTFMNNWRALMYAHGRDRDFEPGRHHGNHPSVLQALRGLDDEDLSHDADHALYLSRLAAQMRLEEKELRISGCAGDGPGRRAGDPSALDAASAIVALTPSPTMRGALPRAVLAILHESLGTICAGEPPLNAAVARAFILAMLHTGRRPEWLLATMLGRRPTSIRTCTQSVYDPVRRTIFHRPRKYLRLPKPYTPPGDGGDDKAWAGFERAWREHDGVYESIQTVWEIPLPSSLDEPFFRMLRARRRAAGGAEGPLWMWEEKGKTVPLTIDHVSVLLGKLTGRIRERIPRHPPLTPSNFTRTFEGWYAGEGMRPEYRWYISGRLAHGAEMENIYSRVSSRAVIAAMEETSLRVLQAWKAGGVPVDCLSASPAGSREAREDYFGSWRVARRDLIVDLVRELQTLLECPESLDPDLPRREALHNARVRLAVIGLGLLNGVRAVEITRLRNQDFDHEGGWIAIRGKSRPRGPAYRCLPLLPEMTALIKKIIPAKRAGSHPRSPLFTFADSSRKRCALGGADIDGILDLLGGRMGYTRMPSFHGLRHRFRSDWLEQEAPCDLLDYLMGHESVGMEAHSIYRDSNLEGLREIYLIVAGELADRYGWKRSVL